MSVNSLFKIREEASESLLALLAKTTLGTNGARYRHLDTPIRIRNLFKPIFYSLERNGKTLGNITICRRKCGWYVRYFAFDSLFQSSGKIKSKNSGSKLKKEINNFLNTQLSTNAPNFYAYIDPKNVKSKWISEQLDFKKIADIATQTFSRINPKAQLKIERLKDEKLIKELVDKQFGESNFYFNHHLTSNKDPFYVYKVDNEIVAFAKFHKANWVIEQLPGKHGKLLTKLIPFIPFVNRIVKPKKHSFLVPEAVYIKNNSAKLFSSFFESVLQAENSHLMLWWINQSDKFYNCLKTEKVNWGLLHKINGVHMVELLVKSKELQLHPNKSTYVCGYDFI